MKYAVVIEKGPESYGAYAPALPLTYPSNRDHPMQEY
jgi:hypothetical protein